MKKIPLTQGKFAIVDDADFGRLMQYKWRFDASRAARGGCDFAHGRVTMEQEIMHPPKGRVVDHRDGNRLDNRRRNLYICTPTENARNRRKQKGCSSHFIGVSLHHNRKWVAYYHKGGRQYYLGSYTLEEQAAKVRDAKIVSLGLNDKLNFKKGE